VAERNGQALVEKSYGRAVEEWQIPNSADTKFETASLSKQFTAAAILQLADASKFNVEDPVSNTTRTEFEPVQQCHVALAEA
jgi:D-alanyl-D-alanine carboxypeptidase